MPGSLANSLMSWVTDCVSSDTIAGPVVVATLMPFGRWQRTAVPAKTIAAGRRAVGR